MAEKSTTIGGLILSVVSGLAVTFFSLPLLGYDLVVREETPDARTLDIHVFNYGLTTAESLAVIVGAKDSPATFDITSNPYVGNRLVVMDGAREGFGVAELGFLPPLTGVTFKVHANNTDGDEDFSVYVQSKQVSGYQTSAILTTLVLAGMLVSFASFAIVKIRGYQNKRMEKRTSEY